MSFNIIEGFLVILLIALVVTIIFRYLKIPIILGYVLVGMLVGPHVFAWIPNTTLIKELAEFGVALLLFTVGLEFSLAKLFSLRYAVFVLGGLQVVISMIVTILIGLALDMSLIASIIIGGVVAMSSTAIVIKQLTDQLELNTKHGSNAIGILLFQDLAVIPILVFIASIAGIGNDPFWVALLWSFSKGILAIIIILLLGRWLLRPLFRLIAATRIVEIFTLAVLFVAVGAAWLTHILGVSYALGAFLAGIMLAECEYRHQIKIEIRPFRDVLLGLFFISIGMLVNIKVWPQTWMWILLLVVGLMIGKTLLIIFLNRISQYDIVTSTRTGLVLAEGGEFGFAILTLAVAHELLPIDWGQAALAALLISFIFAPLIIRYNKKITSILLPKQSKKTFLRTQIEINKAAETLKNHVIICGFGQVGQNIAKFLNKINYRYLALELDPQIVQNAKLAGDSVVFGDASHPDILKAAKIEKSMAVLISFNELYPAVDVLDHIRRDYPTLPILARSQNEPDRETLEQHGATCIVTEIFEESLTLVHQLLKILNISPNKISALTQEVRDKHYEMLYQVFPGSFTENLADQGTLHNFLRPIPISKDAYSVGRSLGDLGLLKIGIRVISIHRGKSQHLKPLDNTKLQANDIIILFGSTNELEQAEDLLLSGHREW